MLGQQIFFDSIEYCAKRMPKGAVSGEIIAGVEPLEPRRTAGIDWIADHGAFPTVCIFRPTVGSDMEDYPSPPYERDARGDGARLRCVPAQLDPDRRRAEHRSVSIVVNPDDAALLAPRTAGFYAFEAYRRSVRALRPAAVLAPDAPASATRSRRQRRDPASGAPPVDGASGAEPA